ncbi:hypothetical protein HW115_14500 [Verrucomicrobiaceae bacterium N1E253]|uniref:Lipoprotein n=1 Tax=Oceaniferula marina TaxID=2748318 RepID=A0A851GPS6_9BACT|nr:hypothetical protein [Oceaniferula marina]NWK56830.1 hypothetical protein [Oceaniferula marina]
MKTIPKTLFIGSSMVLALGLSSCTTTYDAHGRPVETIDPGAAVVGALAIGAIGYAIGENNSHDHHKHYKHGHHRPPHHGHHGHHRRR